MTTKKQRRRREKQRRHEWEYIKVTDEGEEVVVKSPREADSFSPSGDSSSKSTPVDARGRPLQKPSIQRMGKRALIFGPLLVILVFITGGEELSTSAKIFQAVLLLLIFLPLSYLLDHVMYRTLTRRHERKQAARSKASGSRFSRD